jgi:hypothetical protein
MVVLCGLNTCCLPSLPYAKQLCSTRKLPSTTATGWLWSPATLFSGWFLTSTGYGRPLRYYYTLYFADFSYWTERQYLSPTFKRLLPEGDAGCPTQRRLGRVRACFTLDLSPDTNLFPYGDAMLGSYPWIKMGMSRCLVRNFVCALFPRLLPAWLNRNTGSALVNDGGEALFLISPLATRAVPHPSALSRHVVLKQNGGPPYGHLCTLQSE